MHEIRVLCRPWKGNWQCWSCIFSTEAREYFSHSFFFLSKGDRDVARCSSFLSVWNCSAPNLLPRVLSLEPENEVKDIHSRNSQSLMAGKYVIDQEREGGLGKREREKNWAKIHNLDISDSMELEILAVVSRICGRSGGTVAFSVSLSSVPEKNSQKIEVSHHLDWSVISGNSYHCDFF